MGYKLVADEKAADGMRRIAREQLDMALAEIEDDSLDVHETIHQVRKRCKKLRGLVRLVRPEMEDVYQVENAWYRDSAKTLSPYRDAQALLECYDDLLAHFDSTVETGPFASIRAALASRREELVVEQADMEQKLKVFLDRIQQGRQRVVSWPLSGDAFDLFAKGLQKTYRRGRKGMDAAYAAMTPDAFHEWRKRVKYHWYHVRLLQNLWPNLFDKYAKTVKQLADNLGDDHDLAVLRQTLLAEPSAFGRQETLQAFLGLVDRRQRELRSRAGPLGRRIYCEKPKRLSKRWQSYWEAWQTEQAQRPGLDAVAGRGKSA